jgi:hygromycin-B 7''-O-kinase
MNSQEEITQVVQDIIQHHQLPHNQLKKFSTGTNLVFSYGKFVIKTYDPDFAEEQEIEAAVLQHLLNQLSIQIPEYCYAGIFQSVPYLIMSHVQGELLDQQWQDLNLENKASIMGEIGEAIASVHCLSVKDIPDFHLDWNTFIEQQMEHCIKRHTGNGLKKSLILDIPMYIEQHKHLLPEEFRPVLLTGEYTPFNLLVREEKEQWSLSGMIDFADCMKGFYEYDLLGPAVFMAEGDQNLLKPLFLSYGFKEDELNDNLKKRLTLLFLLHRYSNFKAQIRIEGWEERVHSLNDLERLLWNF